MNRITPLLRFVRALEPDQRKAFASAVGTTEGYLYQLAGSIAPNPRLRMAHLMTIESKTFAKKAHCLSLSYDDLLVGVSNEDPDPGPGA